MRYVPSAADTVSLLKLVCELAATIFAPPPTACVLSCTTPRIDPVTSARRTLTFRSPTKTTSRTEIAGLKRFNIPHPQVNLFPVPCYNTLKTIKLKIYCDVLCRVLSSHWHYGNSFTRAHVWLLLASGNETQNRFSQRPAIHTLFIDQVHGNSPAPARVGHRGLQQD